jgi:hypothetical protein
MKTIELNKNELGTLMAGLQVMLNEYNLTPSVEQETEDLLTKLTKLYNELKG